MSWRDYTLANLRWKVAALLLSIVAWFSIQWAIRKGFGEWRAQTLRHQLVQVLTTPGDFHSYRVEPPEVEVVVRPRPGLPKNFSDQTVQVFVNLSDVPDVPGFIREVLVFTRGQYEVLRTEPKVVYVERVGGPRDFLTNSVTKP